MVSSEMLVGREGEGVTEGGGGERGVVERLRDRRAGWGAWGMAREDSLQDLSERRAGEEEVDTGRSGEGRGEVRGEEEGEGISTDRGGERDSNLEPDFVGTLIGMKEGFGGEEGGEMERGGMAGRVRDLCVLGGDTGGEERGEVREERVGEVGGEVVLFSFWKNDTYIKKVLATNRIYLKKKGGRGE